MRPGAIVCDPAGVRALQGISGACFTTASLALLAAAYQGPGRARAFGIVGTVIGAAMVAGPPLGALIASTIGWRWIFCSICRSVSSSCC